MLLRLRRLGFVKPKGPGKLTRGWIHPDLQLGFEVVSGSLLPFWPLIPSGIWAAVLVAEMVFGKKDDGKTGKEGKED